MGKVRLHVRADATLDRELDEFLKESPYATKSELLRECLDRGFQCIKGGDDIGSGEI